MPNVEKTPTSTAHATIPGAMSPRDLAIQRLTASRTNLRRELLNLSDPADGTAASHSVFNVSRRLRALWRTAKRGLRGSPMATVAMTALQEWWQGHPWRATSELVAGELRAAIAPAVRRHPLATTLIAGALGIAVVAGKPWRWPFVARQIQPMPARLARWFFAQLGQAPGQALLSGLLLMMARQSARDDAREGSPAASAQGGDCQPRPTQEHAQDR